MKKLIQTLIFILDALLWAFWVLIVARMFPMYGDILNSFGKPLSSLEAALVAIGQSLNWGPMILLAQLGPLLLAAAVLRPQAVDAVKLRSHSLRLTAALVLLWAVTAFALASMMSQMG